VPLIACFYTCLLIFFLLPGIAASCETLLLSEMSVIVATTRIINANQPVQGRLTSNQTEPDSYKFFVPPNTATVTWRLTIQKFCQECSLVSFYVQSNGLPSQKNHLQNAIINPNQTGDVQIEFYPHENCWHFVDLDFIVDEDIVHSKNRSRNNTKFQELEYTVEILFHLNEDNSNVENVTLPLRNFESYPLLRQTYREFFMFDYDLLPDQNGTVPLTLNITSGMNALLKFDVNDIYDIGGTLSFAVAMRTDMKGNLIDSTTSNDDKNDHVGVIAEKLIDSHDELSSKFASTTEATVGQKSE
jgi:hypothetical protein